ncbi:MAG: SPFH domain-containing protein [Clostridiales bacterium]|nr:SPFH domain-containing protein [Clostridiales bacterium]
MENKEIVYDEVPARHRKGMPVLLLNIILIIAFTAVMVLSIIGAEKGERLALNIVLIIISGLYLGIGEFFLFAGLKILKPNEAIVLTLFGKYYGTLRGEGFYFVNPFVTAINPGSGALSSGTVIATDSVQRGGGGSEKSASVPSQSRKISLKAMTLNNSKQKINDQLGNPIEIGIVVIWRVVNTAMAVFNVDNYKEFLSIQCDSALRNIVRLYPYDVSGDDNEKTLRGSSQEIADKLRDEIQDKTKIAGLEITEARITHLAYAPEIAAVMLQRQQASAIIDARQMIVEGAVGMVEMALNKLSENQVVQLDEERKAAMVSNLLVVLCGNRDTQPVVNSGSLY